MGNFSSRASILFDLGRWDDLAKLSKKELEKDIKNYDALKYLAASKLNDNLHNDKEKAQAWINETFSCLQTFLKEYPEDNYAHYLNALWNKRLGQNEQADKYIDFCLKRAPNNTFYLNLKAELFLADKDFIEAKKMARKSLAISPYNEGASKVLANLYLQKKTPEKALAIIEKSIEIESSPQLAHLKAKALMALEKLDESEVFLRQEISKYPESKQLSETYLELKNLKQGVSLWLIFLCVVPFLALGFIFWNTHYTFLKFLAAILVTIFIILHLVVKPNKPKNKKNYWLLESAYIFLFLYPIAYVVAGNFIWGIVYNLILFLLFIVWKLLLLKVNNNLVKRITLALIILTIFLLTTWLLAASPEHFCIIISFIGSIILWKLITLLVNKINVKNFHTSKPKFVQSDDLFFSERSEYEQMLYFVNKHLEKQKLPVNAGIKIFLEKNKAELVNKADKETVLQLKKSEKGTVESLLIQALYYTAISKTTKAKHCLLKLLKKDGVSGEALCVMTYNSEIWSRKKNKIFLKFNELQDSDFDDDLRRYLLRLYLKQPGTRKKAEEVFKKIKFNKILSEEDLFIKAEFLKYTNGVKAARNLIEQNVAHLIKPTTKILNYYKGTYYLHRSAWAICLIFLAGSFILINLFVEGVIIESFPEWIFIIMIITLSFLLKYIYSQSITKKLEKHLNFV